MKATGNGGADFSSMAKPSADAGQAFELSKDGLCAVIHL